MLRRWAEENISHRDTETQKWVDVSWLLALVARLSRIPMIRGYGDKRDMGMNIIPFLAALRLIPPSPSSPYLPSCGPAVRTAFRRGVMA